MNLQLCVAILNAVGWFGATVFLAMAFIELNKSPKHDANLNNGADGLNKRKKQRSKGKKFHGP